MEANTYNYTMVIYRGKRMTQIINSMEKKRILSLLRFIPMLSYRLMEENIW